MGVIGEARALLAGATPLRTDCGLLCSRACCLPEGDGLNGMWLFPGEEALYAGVSWASLTFVELDNGARVTLLTCMGVCPRADRPLACRLFPLAPKPLANGGWDVRIDRGARPVCPLCGSGVRGLSPEFVRAAINAFARLAEDASARAHLTLLASVQEEYWTLGKLAHKGSSPAE